ncbi:hypothetical protein A0H81_06737 [Grifola frondosa]|uniref:Uncharacterized protein n=1 Tax=Grifola frondosa TaxID=5627 RepID=A0A1C7M7J2_GRIFR|nr:hypothetical protein A0H81_06737 [Grifola frondosa]
MTVQAHLSSGGASSNSRRQLDKAQGTDLPSSSTPPLHGSQNTPTRDDSHHPNNELHSASGPPSLLLRLSDPSAFSHSMFTAASREPSSGFVDGHPGHMGAKRMSAPEIMARTRARLARLSHSSATDNHSTVSVPAPLKQLHGAGIMEGKKKADAVELVKDALTQHMPPITASEARRTPRETPPQELDVNLRSIGRPIAAGPSASSSCASLNLRAVLLRRLEDEKQNAVNMSQPESGEPSQGAGSAVSMQLMGRSDDDVVKSEPELTAGRAAERREAELRSQAQLRVRLAMAKRAAPHPLDDGRITSSARDGEESISQERLLRAMLKQRRA